MVSSIKSTSLPGELGSVSNQRPPALFIIYQLSPDLPDLWFHFLFLPQCSSSRSKMRCRALFLGVLFGAQVVLAWTPSFSTYTVSPVETLLPPTSTPTDCGKPKCGGECGDGIQQPEEECDLGSAKNGAPNSGCTSDCHRCPVCGDGKTEGHEECDAVNSCFTPSPQ
jgi:hypothetical protein